MKRNIIRFAGLLVPFLIASQAFGATYYISASTGSDAYTAAQAQSKSTPWAHVPGMADVSGNAANYTPMAGDRFIFKGGDIWTKSSLKWTWRWSGTSGSPIYIGVDTTWFTGGSWARPILTAGGAAASADNLYLRFDSDYVTLDNFEFTAALFASGYPYGGNAYINTGASKYLIIQNCYFHGWIDGTPDTGAAILSTSQLPSLNVGMEIRYNVVDGSDVAAVLVDPNCTGACQASGMAFWYGPIVHHNVCRNLSNCYIGAAESFHDNLVEHIRWSTRQGQVHENGFENNSDPCATGLLFYNNVIRHTHAGVNVWIAPQAGCAPSYAWNNVIYDTPAGNVFNIAPALTNPGGTMYIYNNTLQCGPESAPSHVCSACSAGINCIYKNNHLITSNATPIVGGGTVANNVVMTLQEANTSGYTSTQGLAYSPVSQTGPTVVVGENLIQSAVGKVASLANTTSYGLIYNSSSHTVTQSTGISTLRPLSGAWDVGSYMASSSSSNQPPIAPTNLIVQ